MYNICMTNLEGRVEKLEEVVSNLKEIPDDVFEREEEDCEVCGDGTDSAEELEEVLEDKEEETENGVCDAIKSDGDVCGRELPCAYHSEGEE